MPSATQAYALSFRTLTYYGAYIRLDGLRPPEQILKLARAGISTVNPHTLYMGTHSGSLDTPAHDVGSGLLLGPEVDGGAESDEEHLSGGTSAVGKPRYTTVERFVSQHVYVHTMSENDTQKTCFCNKKTHVFCVVRDAGCWCTAVGLGRSLSVLCGREAVIWVIVVFGAEQFQN